MLIDRAVGVWRVLVELPERAAGGFGGGHRNPASAITTAPVTTPSKAKANQ
jgi:hypothetical protein